MIQGNEITTIIPQREPIMMIDKFLGIQDGVSYSALTISPANLFYENGYLNESGLIEHIAQSAAARVGYLCREADRPVPLGFIGSVDKMKIDRLPSAGDEIKTEIRIIQEVFQVSLIQAQVVLDQEVIATCRMKIVLEKDEETVI